MLTALHLSSHKIFGVSTSRASNAILIQSRGKQRQWQSLSRALFSSKLDDLTPKDRDENEGQIGDVDEKKVTAREYAKTISELSKARLSALVVSTTSFGYLAAATPISYSTLAAVSLGTALCSASASTLNQIFEQDRDAKMKRTSLRPLVTKQVVGTEGAYALALASGLSGGTALYLGTDPITTALGVGNIALYAGAYTALKPRSEWNTWVGAVVGGIPPIMGYCAATNGAGIFDLEAAVVGSTLFLWQFPHFFALSWMHRIDYARGGFQMVATNDTPDGCATADLITKYTYYLSAMPFLTTLSGITSSMFAVEGIFLNGYAIYVARNFDKERSNGNARKVFLTSLWYLPVWMILFLLHSNKWKEGVEDNDGKDEDLIDILKGKAEELRKIGRDKCIHEIFVFGTDQDGHLNPSLEGSDQSAEKSRCPIPDVLLGTKSKQIDSDIDTKSK